MEQQKLLDTAMYQTKDYDSFKILLFNRKLDENHVQKLMLRIKEDGFLEPILVNQENKVADGQHRLEAAKRLGVPVLYIKYNISHDKLIKLIAGLNTTSKPWKLYDYFNAYLESNIEEYVWMASLLKPYNLSFQELFKMTVYGTDNFLKNFKNGDVKFTQSQRTRIEDNCKKFNNIITLNENFSKLSATFRYSLIDCIRHPDYEEKRMIEKLKLYGGSILNCLNKIDFLFQIESIYNRGERRAIDFIKTKNRIIKKKARLQKGERKGQRLVDAI